MHTRVMGFLLIAALGTATASAADTYTPTTLTADQVFAKARAAIGRLKPGSYHEVTETTRTGGTTHIDAYHGNGDFVEIQRDGDYTVAFGAHSGAEWEQDENGTVTFVSGFNDRNPFNVAVMNAVKPNNNASSVRVLGVTTTLPACVVVEVSPQAGLLQRRFYDSKTFLLRRIETTDYSGHTSITDYGDFRTAYGITLPGTIDFHDDHPENTTHSVFKSYDAVPPSSIPGGIPKNKPLFDLGGRASVDIPAEFTPEGIFVRVTIDGRGLDFQLDSGASTIVVDADVARQLGLNVTDVQKESFDGEFKHGRTRVHDFQIGDLQAHNVTLQAIPFNHTIGDRKIVGLLGGDFFASERVSVDFKNHRLAVLAPSKIPPGAPWVTIPIQVDDHVPRAHAKFNAVDGAFIVDLGGFETMLYPHFFRQFHPNKPGDVMGQVIGIGGQAVDFHRYTFSRLDFGDLAFADVSAIVASGTKFEGLTYDGLLGRNVLDNFNLIFDYQNSKLYVQSLVQ